MSRPGQEDLTFWANHNGLAELDVEGEVGFGDMARILMRRRSNSDRMRAMRDRFTFRVQEMAALDTPDLFRVELSNDALTWVNQPKEIVVTRGWIFNLPVVIHNRGSASARIALRYGSGSPVSGTIPPGKTAGYFLKVIENATGARVGRVTLSFGGGAADGLAYAPKGAISRVAAMSAEYYFHAAKSFELELPAGKTLIEATRGIEYDLASVPGGVARREANGDHTTAETLAEH